jgi:general stress protein 26
VPSTLSPEVRAILRGFSVCLTATTNPNGSTHMVPMQVDAQGDLIILNGVEGRRWVRNLRRTGNVTVTVQHCAHLAEYVRVTGVMAGESSQDAQAHMDELWRRQWSIDQPYSAEGWSRVKFEIQPVEVFHFRPEWFCG